jgi:uncharacterized protein
MPVLSSNFKGSSFFHNAHLETMLPVLCRKITIHYSRERIETPDGDFFDVDRINTGGKQLMILLHGLEGSSESKYIKGFSKYFSSKGWDIAAKNFRSCSGDSNRLAKSYHSGFTTDLIQLIEKENKNAEYDKIVLVGFSLGGNVLLKYLGQNTGHIPQKVKAAIAFSVPIDLKSSSIELGKWHNRIYLNRFLKTLKEKAFEKSKRFNPFPNQQLIKTIKNFQSFDDLVTAPLNGFEGADDYYKKNSSKQFLSDISLNTLLINAENDPFLDVNCFPFEIAASSTKLHFEAPRGGGHVGFAMHLPNGPYWSEIRADKFLKEILHP